MIIMLFGISNVGKTVMGQKLAEKLNYSFFDLDDEIRKRFQMTLEIFMKKYPFSSERFKIKGKILKNLIEENKNDIVIAVSPIFEARNFNSLIDLENVIAIELQDTEEHIFQRLVFSDENDIIYKDDEYKEQRRDYYIKDIHDYIVFGRKTFKKIKNKYFIDNRSVDEVVDELLIMIQNISINK